MKKRRSKIRKILLRTLLFLMLVVGMAGVLSRSKTVQTFLAKKGADWLSKELGVKVRISALSFDFFENLHLEGVYIEDRHGDSMICVQVIDLEINKIDRTNHRVEFGKNSLKSAFVNLGYHKGEDRKNIQFLIDYLDGPPRPKGVPKTIWTIAFSETVLYNSRFYLFDKSYDETEKGLLDQYNLQFTGIYGLVNRLTIVEDSFNFEAVDLKTRERSGLIVRRFNALCNMHYKGMDFTNLDLQTECSQLAGELHWKYPGYKYLDLFIHNTFWDMKLSKSDLCMSELSIFDQSLNGNETVLHIDKARLQGKYDSMYFRGFTAHFGKESTVKGDFFMDGLPDWTTTYCNFKLSKATTSAADLELLLGGAVLPELLHDAGTITATGSFTGRFLDFRWDGITTSAFGSAQTNLLMDLKKGYRDAVFSGSLQSDGMNLSRFVPELGVSVFSVNLDGSGFSKDNFRMTVDADIPLLGVFGRSFEGNRITGDFTSDQFSGKAEFQDLRINSDFEGTINFAGIDPRFDFKANFRGIDLKEVGLDTVHSLIWAKTDVHLSGTNPDAMVGSVMLNDVYFHRKGEVFQYATQFIQKTGKIQNSTITLSGDLVDATIRGNLSLDNVWQLAGNSMADIFPNRIKRVDYHGLDSFEFTVDFYDPALLYAFFVPGLNSKPLHFRGNYAGSNGVAFAELDQTDLNYGGYELRNFEIHADRTRDTVFKFEASALEFVNKGSKQLQNLSFSGSASQGRADFNLKLADRTDKYRVDLNSFSVISQDSITMQLHDGLLKMDNENWTIDDNSRFVIISDGRIICDYLYLDGISHYIEARGVISDKVTDTLDVDLGNFSFDFIRPYLNQSILDSLNGRLNGNVQVAALLGWPRFSGEVNARDLKFYSVKYGDADIRMKDFQKTGRIQLDASFFNGVLSGISVEGNIGYKKEASKNQLNLLVQIPDGTDLQVIQPFLTDILGIRGGSIAGNASITGDFDNPKLSGDLRVNNAVAYIDYLKTAYSFDGGFFLNAKGLFSNGSILMRDESNTGTAKATLAITHNNFNNFYLDFKVDSARNLKCLNTKEGDDDIFYGTAWADGDCHIFGPFDRIAMDINLKSRKNSNLKILYDDVEENDLLGFVTFAKRHAPKKDTLIEKETSYIQRINLTMEATPELNTEFVIDKRLGDAIRGHGSGILKMLYDENENFYLFGTYRVSDGDYVFSIPGINLITKKIALQPGGTIIWSGDPYNALLNMTGSVEKKISPAALMTAVSGGSQKTYTPITVQSILYLSGNLMNPNIRFDIQAPDLEKSSGGNSGDVYRVIQRIRLDKDETMKQAVSLMLFGNFVTPSFAQSTSSGTGVSGLGFSGNSLSTIASSVVNDIFSKAGIPTRIQVNIDDVRSASAGQSGTYGSSARVFVNTEWFLTERVRLDLNYDPTVAVLVNNVTLPLNFNLEYMTRNDNWRIKVFSRSSNLLLQNTNNALTSGVSGNTLGAGVVYRREFDTFRPRKNEKDTTSGKAE